MKLSSIISERVYDTIQLYERSDPFKIYIDPTIEDILSSLNDRNVEFHKRLRGIEKDNRIFVWNECFGDHVEVCKALGYNARDILCFHLNKTHGGALILSVSNYNGTARNDPSAIETLIATQCFSKIEKLLYYDGKPYDGHMALK